MRTLIIGYLTIKYVAPTVAGIAFYNSCEKYGKKLERRTYDYEGKNKVKKEPYKPPKY